MRSVSASTQRVQRTAYVLNSNLNLTQRIYVMSAASDIMCVWMPLCGHMSQCSILQQLRYVTCT